MVIILYIFYIVYGYNLVASGDCERQHGVQDWKAVSLSGEYTSCIILIIRHILYVVFYMLFNCCWFLSLMCILHKYPESWQSIMSKIYPTLFVPVKYPHQCITIKIFLSSNIFPSDCRLHLWCLSLGLHLSPPWRGECVRIKSLDFNQKPMWKKCNEKPGDLILANLPTNAMLVSKMFTCSHM